MRARQLMLVAAVQIALCYSPLPPSGLQILSNVHPPRPTLRPAPVALADEAAIQLRPSRIDTEIIGAEPSRRTTASRQLPRRLVGLSRAGTATPMRSAHYGIGLASLGLGAVRLGNCLWLGFGAAPCTDEQLFLEGLAHVGTAAFGLGRIDWREGREPARRALMAPSVVINLFLWSLLYTDYIMPAPAAVASDSWPVLLLTGAVALVMPYIVLMQNVPGGHKSKSGAPLSTPRENLFIAFLGFVLPIFNVWSTFVWTLMNPDGIALQQEALHTFPAYHTFMMNNHLVICFINNLASLFATFAKYRLTTDQKLAKVFNPLMALVYVSLFYVHYSSPWSDIVEPNVGAPNAYVALPLALLSMLAYQATEPPDTPQSTCGGSEAHGTSPPQCDDSV